MFDEPDPAMAEAGGLDYDTVQEGLSRDRINAEIDRMWESEDWSK